MTPTEGLILSSEVYQRMQNIFLDQNPFLLQKSIQIWPINFINIHTTISNVEDKIASIERQDNHSNDIINLLVSCLASL